VSHQTKTTPGASARKLKPFEVGRGNFTMLHNALLDFVMPRLSGSEWKILCYIVRHTTGFQQASDRISYSQIAAGKFDVGGRQLDAGAGVKSSTTISEALKQLVAAGYIFKTSGDKWEATTYTLNLEFELDAATEDAAPTPKNGVEPTPENGAPLLQKMEQAADAPTPKNGDTKETFRIKETERNQHTHLRAVAAPAESVCVSGFSRQFRERYAANFGLGGGWLTTSDSGRHDATILAELRRLKLADLAATWCTERDAELLASLVVQSAPAAPPAASPNRSAAHDHTCPGCYGTGWQSLPGGARRCTGAPLMTQQDSVSTSEAEITEAGEEQQEFAPPSAEMACYAPGFHDRNAAAIMEIVEEAERVCRWNE
jgi:phage replication O-like protein O